MSDIRDIVAQMRTNPGGVRYAALCKVCDHYFGRARASSGSHRVYKTPWPGDPRVNIQNSKGLGKAYQVRQVLKAIERKETEHEKGE
ncbi:MAG: toxin HicA [Nitrospirae bacterium]|nr:toxin HicA [Nitrospirota bacterium]